MFHQFIMVLDHGFQFSILITVQVILEQGSQCKVIQKQANLIFSIHVFLLTLFSSDIYHNKAFNFVFSITLIFK